MALKDIFYWYKKLTSIHSVFITFSINFMKSITIYDFNFFTKIILPSISFSYEFLNTPYSYYWGLLK